MYLRSMALAFIFLSPLQVFADEAAPREKFTIKGDPPLGSNIRSDHVTGMLPFDKAYGELSLEQQAMLKEQYEALGEQDEPPYPLYGTKDLFEYINKANGYIRARGILKMYVTIDDKGNPVKAEISKTPDPQIAQAVAHIVMLTKFKPGVFKGKPCEMVFPIAIEFKQR